MVLWLRSLVQTYAFKRGQGLVEYAFLIIMVGVVLVAILAVLGPGLSDIYQNIIDQLNGV